MAKSTIFVRSFLLLAIVSFGVSTEVQTNAQLLQILPSPDLSKLDPLLQRRLSDPTGRSRVIVRATSASAVGAVVLLVRQLGGITGRRIALMDAVVADFPNASLATLTTAASVKRIALD